ncbi:MAG: PGPGW domain-containing protein [Nocardioides sp.]
MDLMNDEVVTAVPVESKRFGRLKRWHARARGNRVSAFFVKIVVTIVGLALLALGFIMLFTPGQGILAIVAGLAVLATEYEWAKRLVRRAKAELNQAREKARAVDPAVRRRRIVVTTLLTVLVAGGLTAYLVVFDWPDFAVAGWNWVQSFTDLVPELPGM